MRILLLGDYSNVHATLAVGLRALGHQVVVASDGDSWKGYERDVDLSRKSTGKLASANFLYKLMCKFRHFKGFDIVQLINPVFLELKAERHYAFYHYLRKHNRCIVMGAFGMDYYYANACRNSMIFRYSDFNFNNMLRCTTDTQIFEREWIRGEKGKVNRYISNDCDAIVAGLYEYQAAYEAAGFSRKLHFVPFPIIEKKQKDLAQLHTPGKPVHFFIGIQSKRSVYKGTDIMLRALRRVEAERRNLCHVTVAISLPFKEYIRCLNKSHVMLDQLYSYTPAMNALEAMSRGIVVVGGGEPENYEILQENELRPIVNVKPTEAAVYDALNDFLDHPEKISKFQRDSILYIHRHHECITVAKRYEALYYELLLRDKNKNIMGNT